MEVKENVLPKFWVINYDTTELYFTMHIKIINALYCCNIILWIISFGPSINWFKISKCMFKINCVPVTAEWLGAVVLKLCTS